MMQQAIVECAQDGLRQRHRAGAELARVLVRHHSDVGDVDGIVAIARPPTGTKKKFHLNGIRY